MVGTAFMIGIFFGSLALGGVSDVFGRKVSVTIGILFAAVSQLAGGFTQSYATYTFTRFLAAVGELQR